MLPGNRQRRRFIIRVLRVRVVLRVVPRLRTADASCVSTPTTLILTTTPPYATPDAATRPAVVGTTHASERPPTFSAAWRARWPSRVRRAQCVVAAAAAVVFRVARANRRKTVATAGCGAAVGGRWAVDGTATAAVAEREIIARRRFRV